VSGDINYDFETLKSGAQAMQQLGQTLQQMGGQLKQVRQQLKEHCSEDESGMGEAVVDATDDAAGAGGDVFSEAGRVMTGMGGRTENNGGRAQNTDETIASTLNGMKPGGESTVDPRQEPDPEQTPAPTSRIAEALGDPGGEDLPGEGDPATGGGTADPEPKALMPGKAAKSIQQVRNIRDPVTRWQAAEENARQRYGGGPERSYPVPANSDPDFPVTRATTRKVDCPVDTPGGGTLAVEVKMYQQYRSVQVAPGQYAPQKVEVPLSDDIKAQINKDVALRNADSGYDPRWEFQGAGPSQDLRDHLTKAGIIFIEHK
jgi:hypothetical protein